MRIVFVAMGVFVKVIEFCRKFSPLLADKLSILTGRSLVLIGGTTLGLPGAFKCRKPIRMPIEAFSEHASFLDAFISLVKPSNARLSL